MTPLPMLSARKLAQALERARFLNDGQKATDLYL